MSDTFSESSGRASFHEELQAPWNKQLTLTEKVYDGGFATLLVRIKEGKRFTDLELDFETADKLARLLGDWATHAKDRQREDTQGQG